MVPRDTLAKHLSKSSDKRKLAEDFVVEVTLDNGTKIIIKVPKNYVSDGASIPKIFHRVYHPFTTESFWASVIHDYIYSHLYYKFSKEFADELFKTMIKEDNGSWLMQKSFYRAVRLNAWGGGWNE